ncbi:TWiK family of potassium channels protein 7 [Toxocara canis]|uniref:TWiK family of potassium channels protein 7 n=1 Tax=Toxocara canis TaxID=6265 RepID=A0A0B2VN49_TOXCA|nr:TWiK family of potassium channels protein 7 [Toxocara canis]
MCGIMQSSICRFTELTPGQFGLTKQLVLRIALPHVSLLVVAVGYAIFGSWVLTAIKYRDGTSEVIDELDKAKRVFFAQLLGAYYRATRKSDSERAFVHFSETLYSIYSRYPKSPAIAKSIESGISYANDDPTSNITWNLFFAVTTLTSIGYGANAPDSVVGRLFIVGYILFGIPLYLITMADLAKFCTEFMNRTYTEFLKYRFHLHRKYRRWKKGRQRRESVAIGEIIIAGGEEEVAEFLWTHLESTKFVEVPFLLIYFSLLLYVLIATYLISSIEGWNSYDGFYFVMMSVLTIGFGDLVPRNQTFILLTLFIILLGLILMTTTIDVVGAYYIDRLHFFGRRLETQDPLAWLKAVQRKRIEAMKREAMRKLFETVTALQHLHFGNYQNMNNIVRSDRDSDNAIRLPDYQNMNNIVRSDRDSDNAIRLPDPPDPPRGIVALNATAESVTLKWEAPLYVDEGKRYWYTLTYKTRTPQGRNNPMTVIDFINTTRYEVCEPCTVPQSLRIDAVSSETATFSWRAPRKNNGSESYVIQFSQEPAPQFHYWRRYRCGNTKKFTITDLTPETRYIMCVSAEHNFGMAAMSKSVRFKTKQWWCDDEGSSQVMPPFIPLHQMDTAFSGAGSATSALQEQ